MKTKRIEKQEKQWLTDNMKEMIETFRHTLKQQNAKRYKDRTDTLDDEEPVLRQHIESRHNYDL
jgi:hypothetical protein